MAAGADKRSPAWWERGLAAFLAAAPPGRAWITGGEGPEPAVPVAWRGVWRAEGVSPRPAWLAGGEAPPGPPAVVAGVELWERLAEPWAALETLAGLTGQALILALPALAPRTGRPPAGRRELARRLRAEGLRLLAWLGPPGPGDIPYRLAVAVRAGGRPAWLPAALAALGRDTGAAGPGREWLRRLGAARRLGRDWLTVYQAPGAPAAIRAVLIRLGRRRASGRRGGRRRLEVVLYHSVAGPEAGPAGVHRVAPEAFAAQLGFLRDNFHLVRLGELPGLLGGGGRGGPFAAVCFDDGYRDNLTVALPILAEYRVPASLFITGAAVAGGELLWRELVGLVLARGEWGRFLAFLASRPGGGRYDFGLLRVLPFDLWSKEPRAIGDLAIREHLREYLARRGIAIGGAARGRPFLEAAELTPHPLLEYGNHTWSHPLLTLLGPAGQREEIARCHRFLAARGLTPAGLALPFAPFDAATVAVCRELGYAFLATVSREPNPLPPEPPAGPLLINRLLAPPGAEGLDWLG